MAQNVSAGRQALNQCIDAMLLGPERKHAKLLGVQMNCKRANVTVDDQGEALWVRGTLSFHRPIKGDHQTAYSFFVEPDGAVSRVSLFYSLNPAGVRIESGFKTRSEIQSWRNNWNDRVRKSFPWSRAGVIIAKELGARLGDSRMRANGDIKTGQFEYFVDRPGSDMKRLVMDEGPGACRSSCSSEKSCMAWTWVQPGVQESDAVCWLKDDTQKNRVKFNENTVSGLKSGYELME
jgi:hypothetical protein